MLRRAFVLGMFGLLTSPLLAETVQQTKKVATRGDVPFSTPEAPKPPKVVAEPKAPEKDPKTIQWETDLNKGRAAMEKTRQPMMLFLTAPGCVYCEEMKRDTFSQAWIIKEVNKKYTPVLINGREHKEIADRLSVRMFPATAIVHPTGKVLEVVHGYRKPADFLKHMAVGKAKLDIENRAIASKMGISTLK